jgi:lantibiotic modifying enzyme
MFPDLADHPVVIQRTTGWCGGDLGISIALYNSATVLANSYFASEAVEIALAEAALQVVDIEHHNQRNYNLCHGAAGRAHIFNRFYQYTGNPAFKKAALYWFGHLLELAEPDGAGCKYLLDEPLDGGPKAVHGFLMGTAGLGLALIAATTSMEPRWDELLLASIDHSAR